MFTGSLIVIDAMNFPGANIAAIVIESFSANSLSFYVLSDKEGKVIDSSNDQNLVRENIE